MLLTFQVINPKKNWLCFSWTFHMESPISYSVMISFLISGPSISSKYRNHLKLGTFSFRISYTSGFHIYKPSMLSTFSNQTNWSKLLFFGFPLIVAAIFLDLVLLVHKNLDKLWSYDFL